MPVRRIENLHFDEAWLPHAAFHPFDASSHSMGRKPALLLMNSAAHAALTFHKLFVGILIAAGSLV
ncbi:hypothetical protein [Hoeflea halophila]|uniref:hypothetical protein n=1 Tax=Hoeflea halophila TaxID=714899 RepID=UPI0015CC76B8